MQPALRRLIYVADPMCSWCWGFSKELQRLRALLLRDAAFRDGPLDVEWILGGLAPDDDAPMPQEMRDYIRGAWDQVERTTGAQFNRDFWERCEPRRSTYPACRAVIAAEALRAGSTPEMFDAIQRAYYLEAKNPSDAETLVECAASVGFEAQAFASALAAPETQAVLESHFERRDALQAQGFPSLYVLSDDQQATLVMRGYATAEEVSKRIETAVD